MEKKLEKYYQLVYRKITSTDITSDTEGTLIRNGIMIKQFKLQKIKAKKHKRLQLLANIASNWKPGNLFLSETIYWE